MFELHGCCGMNHSNIPKQNKT